MELFNYYLYFFFLSLSGYYRDVGIFFLDYRDYIQLLSCQVKINALILMSSKRFIFKKMENRILESVKHIKNISKKKVTVEKIFTNIKKRNLTITYEELQHILDKMVTDNTLHEAGMVYQEHI